jgi:hypothetical protein
MLVEPHVFNFRSDLFPVDPKEDEKTNPFCYGRSLAQWIHGKFTALGYSPEPVMAEDWGWCVMLRREPFLLWIGCGNVTSEMLDAITPERKSVLVPDGKELTWSCFVGTDAPVWTSFFWRKLFRLASESQAVQTVTQQLEIILCSESRIRMDADSMQNPVATIGS